MMNERAKQVRDNLVKEFNLDRKAFGTPSYYTSGHCAIGVEIEVKWRDYFPQLYKKYFKGRQSYTDLSDADKELLTKECDKLERSLLSRLQQTVDCGIPRGADRYWEFAFVPSTDPYWTIQQINALQSIQLIPPRGKHSMHITISDLRANRDTYYMLMVLEMLFGDKERIMDGFNKQNTKLSAGWARKGYAGLFEKDANDLAYGAEKAIELRPLYLTKTTDIDYMLLQTQYIAEILYKKQNGIASPLIERWDMLVSVLSKKLTCRGMTDANWKKPHMDPANWNLFIEHFDDIQSEVKIAWRHFHANIRREKEREHWNLYCAMSSA